MNFAHPNDATDVVAGYNVTRLHSTLRYRSQDQRADRRELAGLNRLASGSSRPLRFAS